ncbi:hypothetical protein Tco_0612210, partial [Tanacetum coccineum]
HDKLQILIAGCFPWLVLCFCSSWISPNSFLSSILLVVVIMVVGVVVVIVGSSVPSIKLSFVIIDSFSCYWSSACPGVLSTTLSGDEILPWEEKKSLGHQTSVEAHCWYNSFVQLILVKSSEGVREMFPGLRFLNFFNDPRIIWSKGLPCLMGLRKKRCGAIGVTEGVCLVNMDDPNITMEEYIRLEEEKDHRRGKVYNWKTATYGKIWNVEDVHDLRYVETEFPTIVFNDALKSEVALSCEPTPKVGYSNDLDFFKDFKNEFPAIVYNDALTSKSNSSTKPVEIPHRIDESDLKTESSLYECDEKEQNISFNVIYPDDSKSDTDNDNDKIDIEQSLGNLSVKPLPDVISTDVGVYEQDSIKYECAGDVIHFRTWLGISIRDNNNEYYGFRWSNLFKLVNF